MSATAANAKIKRATHRCVMGFPPVRADGRSLVARITLRSIRATGRRSTILQNDPCSEALSLPVFGEGGALLRAGWGCAAMPKRAPPDLASLSHPPRRRGGIYPSTNPLFQPLGGLLDDAEVGKLGDVEARLDETE